MVNLALSVLITSALLLSLSKDSIFYIFSGIDLQVQEQYYQYLLRIPFLKVLDLLQSYQVRVLRGI